VVARHVEDAPLRCTLNPAVGKGRDFSQIGRAEVRKRVLVIGGGPAGMEAARVAAQRGHQVALYEKEDRLGGALHIASVPPGKEKLDWVTEYYSNELPRLNVELHLGEMVDAEMVRAWRPDAVIVATGSDPAIPDVPGVDGSNVIVAQTLLARKMQFADERIAIIGGGMLGLETAEYLAAQGNAVTVLKRYTTVSRLIEPLYRDYLLRKLKEEGVEFITEVEVEEITGSGVVVLDKQGVRKLIPADWVVMARGASASNNLAREIEKLHPVVIGDAVEPRKIIDAIHEGFVAAKAI
jgi:2-enoate reductase